MVSITLVTRAGPHFHPHGEYHHAIGWQTTGRDGYIVQHFTRKIVWTDTAGLEHSQSKDYWEAWRVDSLGGIYPVRGAKGLNVHDYFKIGGKGPNTAGKWRIKADVYWMAAKDFVPAEWAKSGASDNSFKMFPDAGVLHHRTSHPGLLKLGLAKRRRNEAGHWDDRSNTAKFSHKARG